MVEEDVLGSIWLVPKKSAPSRSIWSQIYPNKKSDGDLPPPNKKSAKCCSLRLKRVQLT